LNPLIKIKEAHQKGILPDKVFELILERFPIVVSGIDRIEKASGINYPVAYVDPSIVLSSSSSYDYFLSFNSEVGGNYSLRQASNVPSLQ